jgi:hypothetical protein
VHWEIFVLALVVLGPLARAVSARISRPVQPVDTGLVQSLRRELEATEARTQESDRRIAQLEDRLDFMEKLLREPKSRQQLPPGG